MKAQKISKSKMVAMMGVSRSHLDSLLDESNSRLTLKMLASVSIALQKKLRVELVA